MLTLVTYNLYKGGAPNYSAFGRALTELSPDILLLQEVSKPEPYVEHAPEELRERIADARWGSAGTNYWGSAIYVRQGILSDLPIPDVLQGWVTAADMDGLAWRPGEKPLRIFCVHTPTRESRDYIAEVHRIIDAIKERAEGYDMVIGGDFNMTVGVCHEAETRQNTLQELAIHRRLRRELGLINSWQVLHPNQVLPQTYQHQFQADSALHHLDGLFVPATWYQHLESCDVLNGAPWVGRSDHFPLIASFAL